MKWNKAGEKLNGKQKTEDPCVGLHDTSIAKVAQNVWHNLLSYRGSNKIVNIYGRYAFDVNDLQLNFIIYLPVLEVKISLHVMSIFLLGMDSNQEQTSCSAYSIFLQNVFIIFYPIKIIPQKGEISQKCK